MNATEEKALREFLLDIDCLKQLDRWADDVNLFDVLKITNAEIRHSNILAWLLNPNENHGLGDAFIRAFITMVVGKCDPGKIDAFKLLLQDFYSYQIYRESNHMDIVMYSHEEKTAIIIENKIWASESTHQLSNYRAKSKQEYSDCERILYVLLTPYGYEASDPENWVSISYNDVIEALLGASKGLQLKPEIQLIISNYIETVRKNIMKEDQDLVRICNEIYIKHRTALRLIFENVSINDSLESEIICGTLQELNDEGKILYYGTNKWHFFTKAMSEFLPDISDANSSWGTKYVYYYWFEKGDEHLIIHFELGGWGIDDELKAKESALITVAGKRQDSFKYKRLYYKKVKLSQDDYEGSLKRAVKNLVKGALENEEKLLTGAKAILQGSDASQIE